MKPIDFQKSMYEKLCSQYPYSKLIKVARPKPNDAGQMVISYRVEHRGEYLDRTEVL